MANETKPENKKPGEKTPSPAGGDLNGGGILALAAEADEDNRNFYIGLAIATVFHGILLFAYFPKSSASEPTAAEKPKVYVVQQVRFQPPPPPQQQEIPQPKAKKVPIPDPTPDEPEPIRLEEEIEPELEMPDTDLIFDIPAGPPPTAAEPTGPIYVGGDVQAPVKVNAPQPQYTEIARKARIQGVVIVQAIIDKEGNVQNVKVLKGLPMGLDQAAVEAIKSWKFKPATLNGKPVTVYYNLTVNFTLQ